MPAHIDTAMTVTNAPVDILLSWRIAHPSTAPTAATYTVCQAWTIDGPQSHWTVTAPDGHTIMHDAAASFEHAYAFAQKWVRDHRNDAPGARAPYAPPNAKVVVDRSWDVRGLTLARGAAAPHANAETALEDIALDLMAWENEGGACHYRDE